MKGVQMKIEGKLIKYKLTDSAGYTQNNTLWTPGRTNRATGEGAGLCSDAVIHFYDSPLVAVLLNPTHANIANPLLWEIEVDGVVAHDGTKGGTKTATTIRQMQLPVISTNQRIRFAIFCALAVYEEPDFVAWANNWLSGKDRTAAEAAAWAAARAAWAAARAAEATARAAVKINLPIIALKAMEVDE